MKTYKTLQELTSHESGAVLYQDGEVIICNWSQVYGLPRLFVGEVVGLGEPLRAVRCAVPAEARRAMREHEREQGAETPSRMGYKAWRVNDEAVVVVQEDWA